MFLLGLPGDKDSDMRWICAAAAVLLSVSQAAAEDGGGLFNWVHGDWYLTIGGAGYIAPKYTGDNTYEFTGQPLISLGKAGEEARFISRNDAISLSLFDRGSFRFGAAGNFIWKQDDGTSDDLKGLSEVPFGGEAGIFAEVYPTEWLRVRGELFEGIKSYDGLFGDVTADAFTDLTPRLRLSGGPRLSFAGAGYFDAYYGVTPEELIASGLPVYDPGSGINSVGAGGALTWKTTDRITTSFYAEYTRLLGPAADSSLVEERGSANQFLVGISGTYRFDFRL